jgi:arylformamidase
MEITLDSPVGLKKANFANPISLGISLKSGPRNPNCYYAEDPLFDTIVSGEFVGDVSKGGPVNYQKVTFTPHGNGTHTECAGHITSDRETIAAAMKSFHFFAEIITVLPRKIGSDEVIQFQDYFDKRKYATEALIIRTLPNGLKKKTQKYSGKNPPYLAPEIADHLSQSGVQHLIVDLPSVDKEVDGGKLKAHRNFWNISRKKRANATITELAYIPDEVSDGLYLLNLQMPLMEIDATPSNPIIYKLF